MKKFYKAPHNLIFEYENRFYNAKIHQHDNDAIELKHRGQPKIIMTSPLKNKNDTAEIIKEYKRHGLIKNCSNLSIEVGTFLSNHGFCYPFCEQQSLNYEAYGKGRILQGCSESCNYYKSSRKKILINFIKKFNFNK